MFISIDGDDIGSELERLVVLCQPEMLAQYWRKVSEVMAQLEKRLRLEGAQILLCGGDSVLAELDTAPSSSLIYLLFSDTLPISFSVGTGQTMLEAYIALKTAKASGKRCWIDYSDLSSIRQLPFDVTRNVDHRLTDRESSYGKGMKTQ